MTLRWRIGAYLVGLHLLFLAFSVVLYHDQPALFIGVELLLAASLAGGFHLIRRALEPLSYTRRFRDLLANQNYAARLTSGSERELGELVGLFNSLLETLYRERLELGEQQGLLDRLLEATPSAVLVFDFDGRISLLNASAQVLLGLEQPYGQPLAHWLGAGGSLAGAPAADERARRLGLLAQLDALQLGASDILTDAEGRRYRATRGQFFDRGFARHFLMIEELTLELERSERGAYEKLIRVMAHEVNNTVAATGSVLESLLFYRSQLSERDSEDFHTAVVAIQRRNVSLGQFVERFTRVVRMPAPELRPCALVDMLNDILWLSREQCKARGIDIAWGRCDAVPTVRLDSELMEQALLNIIKNAMEAAEETCLETGAGGYVRLELASEGSTLRLSVLDSGDRLRQAPAQPLFTPFFTTKKGGQGIGLLFVREVLNRHGVSHRLAANGKGETQFDLWFGPACATPP